MVAGAEAAQLDLFAVDNLLGVTVAPFHGHLAVGVGVDEDVEGALVGQLGEEGDGGCDLAEDGGDLVLDLLFGLFGLGGAGGATEMDGAVSVWREGGVGEDGAYPGAAFSWSAALDALFDDFEDLEPPKIWTSNCQRSTCSPVSLLVMTMTSLDILPYFIQRSSWLMIFLMYALTWSSAETWSC
jgi:hypothetical protein